MRRGIVVGLVAVAACMPAAGCEAQRTSIRALSWMAGCWRQSNGSRILDEQWMSPGGGTMLGMARTVRGDSLIEFEHLQVLERDGNLVYHAEPSGQQPADFAARVVSDTLVMFENPTHDFPQRVMYRRRPDSLVARIEGTRNGRVRGIDFPYIRASCP